MKIAILTDTHFPEQVNGVARMARVEERALSARGHEVRVWSVHNVPSVPFWGYKGERFALPYGRAYREVLEWQPDIIHTHTPFTLGWEAVFASRPQETPLVGTHHTFFDHYLKHLHVDSALARELSWKYLIAHYNHYDLVLSPSEALLLGMKEHGLRSEASLLPNGIDTDLFRPAQGKEPGKRLVYMGRVSYEKSIDKVILAFALVHKAHPESSLTIIGDGPERTKLEALSERLGMRDRIVFTGMKHDEDLVRALQVGDVFITASKSENMPLSVIEAMATGLPVIGVDALGMPAIVENGVSGIIVEPDDAEALAAAIDKLFSDPDLRGAYARAAREAALAYGEAAHAEALEAMYLSLLNQ